MREKASLGRGRRVGDPHCAQHPRTDGVGRGVDGDRPGAAGRRHQQPRDDRTGDAGRGLRDRDQRVRRLQIGGADDLRHQAVAARHIESRAGADQRHQHHDDGERRVAAQQQHRQDRLAGEPQQVGADHHGAAREAVGGGTADKQQENERYRLRRQHFGNRACAVATAIQREREGERHHGAAEQRGRKTGDEAPEIGLLEGRGENDQVRIKLRKHCCFEKK
jgi:hypothetical protein